MNCFPSVKQIPHLRIWPEETSQNAANSASNIKALLRIARAETGAVTSILGVADNDSQSGSDDGVGKARSLKRGRLESNAAAIEKCLHTRNVVECGPVGWGQSCERQICSFRASFGIVFVPLMYKDIPCGCMLLIFAEPGEYRTLHPSLGPRLLHLGQILSELLDKTRCGKASGRLRIDDHAPFAKRLPGRLSELETVLHDGATTWEDIGEQLSSYLRGPFAT